MKRYGCQLRSSIARRESHLALMIEMGYRLTVLQSPRYNFMMMMTRSFTPVLALVIGFALLAFSPVISDAKPGAAAEQEIEHLLEFVADSDVSFLRNGDSHKPKEAAEHIRKKYDYYLKKIFTAEDFIRLSATKSALSGKIYHVQLANGTKQTNSEWLLAELERYRKAKGSS